MLDDSTGLQLAGLVSAASQGYSPPNSRNVAARVMQETNVRSNCAEISISAGQTGNWA
jgi:hypothetical protein